MLPSEDCKNDNLVASEAITSWYTNVMAEIGSNVALRCNHVSSGHKRHVEWSLEGRKLEQSERIRMGSDGSLIIFGVKWEDMGTYTCSFSDTHASVETFLYPLTSTYPGLVGRK